MPKPYLQLHSLVLVLAFTAVLGELISLSAVPLVCWRTGIAALCLFTILRPKETLTKNESRLPLATGCVLGLHWITFFGAIKLANISICLTGLATISLFTAVLEALQERRKPHGREILLGCIIIPSLLLIIGVTESHWLGLGCAVLSSFLAATFTVINKALVRKGLPAGTITQYEMLGAFAVSVLATLLMQPSSEHLIPSAMDALWLGILAIVCTAFAFQWHVSLLRHFSAFEANLAINLEPVYGILMAALLFNEHHQLHPLFYLGAGLILASNFLTPALDFLQTLKKKKAR